MPNHFFSQNGLTACCTDTSITLFWDKPAAAGAVETYTVLLDDAAAAHTQKTHCTLENLRPETTYSLFVQWRSGSIGELTIRTTPTKRCLDVTASPYSAVGDGKAMNTAALQKAIDDCGEREQIYFPAGVYCTGTLRLHSNMELYLEEGAVLQGTADPEDYLPRISSRFEGTEMECYSSLLNLGTLDHTAGPNCENVILRGKGTIASGGKLLAERISASERERLKDRPLYHPVGWCLERGRLGPGFFHKLYDLRLRVFYRRRCRCHQVRQEPGGEYHRPPDETHPRVRLPQRFRTRYLHRKRDERRCGGCEDLGL